MLREHKENVEELVHQVQGQQLRGILGPRLAGRLCPGLHFSVAQRGHPQCVQQGDEVGKQLGLQKPEAKYGESQLSGESSSSYKAPGILDQGPTLMTALSI